jgi:branched-chain amino acid transport system substrate-binding protein
MWTRRTVIKATLAAAAVGVARPRRAVAEEAPWRVGFSLSLTGEYAEVARYQGEGYELWRRRVNASAERLLGRPVEFVRYDDRSDPAAVPRLYEKLIRDDQVDFVLGPYSTATTQEAAPVVERYGLPMMTAGASSEGLFRRGYRNLFMTLAPARDYLDGAVDIAKRRGLKRIAAVHENTPFPRDSVRKAVELSRREGLEVLVQETYPQGVTDLSAIVAKAREEQVDAIFAGSYLPDAVLLIRTCKELNVNPKMIAVTVGAARPEFGAGLGRDADFVFGASQWEPDPALPYPGIRAFIEDYKKAFDRAPDYHAASGYQAGEVLAAALGKVGRYDRNDQGARGALREAIRATDVMTVNGRFKVDPAGVQIGHDVLLVQWQKGNKVVVWPEQYAAVRYLFPMPAWGQRG